MSLQLFRPNDMRTLPRFAHLASLTIALSGSTSLTHAQTSPREPYDPLAITAGAPLAPLDLDVRDPKRNRTIPIRVYRPRTNAPAPVLLFSHGLGGARTNNAFLGTHWAARGYIAVFLQHPGSDETLWKDTRPARALLALRRAASAENLLLRVADVPAVLDAITAWNSERGHQLAGAFDMSRVGMSGHSFGAVTTQAVSGQSFPRQRTNPRDARIDAALILSPSVPQQGDAQSAFGDVTTPWLLMTGTKDVARIGGATLDDRLAVFPALPSSGKYELVLFDAEHSAFGDRALPGEKDAARNPNHHRAILALSTAFWDAYLLGNAEARAWLDGAPARAVLEPRDRWQRK